ncbi:MAG TPA: PUA domain-containing protein [Nitrososphaeraceae archaeon]|nr:PUA domain-containing protein [Nitrososphaeraceae archaeon]
MNSEEKIVYQIDALFGKGVSSVIPKEISIDYSRKTGRIKSFAINNELIGTLRSDGGIALTILGASILLNNREFKQNCIIPIHDALPFVSEGRSLFCKHVEWFGSNINIGSEVVVIDKNEYVLAVGKSVVSQSQLRGRIGDVAVKVREGIKSRVEQPKL